MGMDIRYLDDEAHEVERVLWPEVTDEQRAIIEAVVQGDFITARSFCEEEIAKCEGTGEVE